ncbi:GMC family oxidoreductase [Phyllobacterium leguminum]|uniref:Gluconate 2-dehydrogenase alpha chain n=1 Tax=Phyllobacterium leguminum TaxID=314237 RepID=A0A318TAP0_9HYPH|nr:GMC family oxidoreductase [Phyllobacterium leguminum]PYE87908.1 gluconate 2-dehydrogenase alpha chain [Phyllobacterium leguminum]
MATKLPRKDVVIIGLGWTGAILANELTDEGLDVVAIERGPWRDTATDFNVGYMPDELRYAIRKDLFLRPAQSTLTFRNNIAQEALPVREFGSFLPGNGVGGAGVHWSGCTWRFLPSDFRCRSHLAERYGPKFIPRELTIQDWGITYEEMEPYYDKFEYLAGISGKAGNINGKLQEGGNPFEGARARDYPLPPLDMNYGAALFAQGAREAGFHPFPIPAGTISRSYTNPLGVVMGACTYCGFCDRHGCANYSKASPQTTVLPVLMRKANFEARTDSEVIRINLDRSGSQATGVTYVDAEGQEWEQPADIVLVCAFILFNVHLLLVSGIGKPYDPKTATGTVGRNYAYQTYAGVEMFFDNKNFNPFISTGAMGQSMDDFNGDSFDHSGLDFVGGAGIMYNLTNGRPIATRPTPPGTPRWGSVWKKATTDNYLSNLYLNAQGSSYATRGNYLDLDPTYKDRLGRPLLRMTFDYPDNDIRMINYVNGKAEEIAKIMNPRQVVRHDLAKPYTVVPYHSTHNTGGAIMGSDPTTSAVNQYLQSWDVPNVFVIGASAFPQNAGYNPTGTVGALAFRAADAIRTHYLKSRGPLVPA